MNTFGQITFAPLVPEVILIAFAILAAVVLAVFFWRRTRGAVWRFLALGILILTLAGPRWIQEETRALPDHVVIVQDRTDSMKLGGREQLADALADEMTTSLEAMPDVIVHKVDLTHESQRPGTHWQDQIQAQTGALPNDQIGAIITLSDGIIHDETIPDHLSTSEIPYHAIIIGDEEEIDRSITISGIPGFAIVGEEQEIELDVHDSSGETSIPGVIDVYIDGVLHQQMPISGAGKVRLTVPIDQPGPTMIEARVSSLEGEISLENNQDARIVNGIRDRLRVLLVSGEPYPGLRVWRNLLKSDPSVDLVHFTILRPPEKQDFTPTRSLALIAFPVRELFEVSLPEFDLIIFDRYTRRGLLPGRYFDNIARYVDEGGALLTVTGPEYADPFSIAFTGLGRVLPGQPTGDVVRQTFRIQQTELGGRHPVSENLFLQPDIGPWHRLVSVVPTDADELLQGDTGDPLLLLNRVGDGRVAQLMSDHVWLWSRDPANGGPYRPLMRRLVHWLMQEPELEEDRVQLRQTDETIDVDVRFSVAPPEMVTVTAPDGTLFQLTEAESVTGATASYRFKPEQTGVHRIAAGEHETFVFITDLDRRERQSLAATDVPLSQRIPSTGGGLWWLNDVNDAPELRGVRPERQASGANWAGIIRHNLSTTVSKTIASLLPAWLGLLFTAGFLGMAWWREGR